MTKEEAIKILKAIRVYECYPKSASEETKEAIDMAIEALQTDIVRCGECKWYEQQSVGESGTCIYGKPIYIVCNDMNFCSFGKRKERRIP